MPHSVGKERGSNPPNPEGCVCEEAPKICPHPTGRSPWGFQWDLGVQPAGWEKELAGKKGCWLDPGWGAKQLSS